jgi:hypothetical protein
MKNLYILLFSVFSFSVSAQKIKAIGIDLGGNIFPLLTKYQGFTGGIVIHSSENGGKQWEYVIGYANLERPNNKMGGSNFSIDGRFTQKSEGFYGSIGSKFSKDWGWHGTLSVYNLTTNLFITDYDFNTSYQYTFPTESLVSAGGDIFLEIPTKISDKVDTNIRFSISLSIGTGTKNADQVLYAPGLNQLTPKIWLPALGFGISVPFLLRLN